MPEKVIGTNTVACIQSGIYWGYIGLIEGLINRIRTERDMSMKVIGTGGLAPLFDQGFDLFDAIEEDLTVHGLRLIYDYNKEAGNV
jgi:type III pantothenate kinase